MSRADVILPSNILFKSFEILALLLYTVDLLPKIFVWKRHFLWKLVNIFIVTMMVLQIPLALKGYLEAGVSIDTLKIRTLSIGLSFLLMLESMSIREQRHIKVAKRSNFTGLKNTQEKKSAGTTRLFTWAEIIKHDRPGDCWIVVHGKVYDLTNFVASHPGGPMIYDGAGGDCTSMWESYHPLAMTKAGPPEKYCIGEVRNYQSFYSWDGSFFKTVKERVEAKIPRAKRRNEITVFLKATALIVLYFFGLYSYMVYCNFWSTVFYSVVCGQIGVQIMHDGNHGAFSSNKLLTYIAGYTLDLLGSTSVVYRRSHNFGHHGCVNHFELDRAFDTTYPLYRLHKFQKWVPLHRYQHIYMWLVYGLVNFGDLFGTFDELFWMSNYPTRRGHVTKTSYISQIIVKLCWVSWSMIIPTYLHGWYHVFPYWVLYMCLFSYAYAVFFAVNHWTEEAAQVDNTNLNKTNWGVLQVENSSNFALQSSFWTHLSGGLNHQIEHHLFPSLAHTRLPEIRDIVQDACKEHNIRYFTFDSFWQAFMSHYDYLKKMGNPDKYEQ